METAPERADESACSNPTGNAVSEGQPVAAERSYCGYTMDMTMTHSALERVLRPSQGDIPRDYAQRLLAQGFDAADELRYRELSEKAQLGQLSEAERGELDDLLTANDVLAILHAKARASLKAAGG